MSDSDECFTDTFATIWFEMCLDSESRKEALRALWFGWMAEMCNVYVQAWGEHDANVLLIWDSLEDLNAKRDRIAWIIQRLNDCPDKMKMVVSHAVRIDVAK